jgi:hypothetical protein
VSFVAILSAPFNRFVPSDLNIMSRDISVSGDIDHQQIGFGEINNLLESYLYALKMVMCCLRQGLEKYH